MKKLGISIYPDRAPLQVHLDYIHLAGQYGFKRIFTCLISVAGNKETILNDFKQIVDVANSYDMAVIADVSPEVFEALDIQYTDLKFFADMGLAGIRLDLGFSGNEESIMTCNPYGLKIEINMSNGTRYLETILSYQPIKENLYGCHNFYPHRYTGLSKKHFLACSEQFRDSNIRAAAFVSSQNAEFGPWPVSDGLCTLEHHRDMNIVTQAKELFNTGLIDDVIIANCFASEAELKALSELNKEVLTFDVTLIDDLPEIETKIVLEEFHFNRGDVSEYMIRSTQSRVKYKGHQFDPINAVDIKKGDIIIDSSLYARYAGELQIAIKDMKNTGKTSVVGRIVEDEIALLDTVLPWQKFAFKLR